MRRTRGDIGRRRRFAAAARAEAFLEAGFEVPAALFFADFADDFVRCG